MQSIKLLIWLLKDVTGCVDVEDVATTWSNKALFAHQPNFEVVSALLVGSVEIEKEYRSQSLLFE